MAIASPRPGCGSSRPARYPPPGSFTVLGSKVRPQRGVLRRQAGGQASLPLPQLRGAGRDREAGSARKHRQDLDPEAQAAVHPASPDLERDAQARRRCTSRPLQIQAQGPGPPRPPHPEVSPGRRQVPGPRAARLRRAGAEVRSSPQRRSRPPGPGRVRRLRHPGGRGAGRARPGARLGPRPVRKLGGDRRPRHPHRPPVRPFHPPGLGPRRRAGAGPASGSAASARPATPARSAACCTSRPGPRAGTAAAPWTRCRSCGAGTAGARRSQTGWCWAATKSR